MYFMTFDNKKDYEEVEDFIINNGDVDVRR